MAIPSENERLSCESYEKEMLRVHERIDGVAREVALQSVRVSHMDHTLGRIVSQQIEDGKKLVSIAQFDAMFLQEVQNVRAENARWHTEWFRALQDTNERLGKGNYFLVVLTCAVFTLCVAASIAIWYR
jgi:lysozyme family protein